MIPAVKQRQLQKGESVFKEWRIFGEEKASSFATAYLQYFLFNSVTVVEKGQENISLVYKKSARQGAYRLCVGNTVRIEYADLEGARNG